MAYRAGAALGVAKIYSRNAAHQQRPVSNFAQNASHVDKCPGSSEIDPPAFSGNTSHCDVEVPESEFEGITPSDWAIKLLGGRQKEDLWGRNQVNSPLSLPGEIAVAETPTGAPEEIHQ